MGFDKKWGAEAERDLAIAIILSQQGERAKYDWPKVHASMQSWSYDFSQDAISQHWTKSVMKGHKARNGDAAGKAGSVPSTPGGQTGATPKTGSKRGKSATQLEGAAAELMTPTKPPKKQRKTAAKKEEKDAIVKKDEDDHLERERSVTMPAGDIAFEEWVGET